MNAIDLFLCIKHSTAKIAFGGIRHLNAIILVSILAIMSSSLLAQKAACLSPRTTDSIIDGFACPGFLKNDTARLEVCYRRTIHIQKDSLDHRVSKIHSSIPQEHNLTSNHSKAFAAIRLKKYAPALKLFYQSLFNKHPNLISSRQQTILNGKKITNIDRLFYADTIERKKLPEKSASVYISVRKILSSFKDGKKAVAYGVFIHIKQPVPGTRRRFKWFDDVGHSFITLSKYHLDGSVVSCTYGYYPNKRFLLQGTPIIPAASSQYKNDAFHDADETLGKFITTRQFHKILRTTKRFAARKYHLNKNNCTDFVLKVATIAGFHIKETKGHWPLGRGNDPGDTGQSILENKIKCDCGHNFLKYSWPRLKQSHRISGQLSGVRQKNSDSVAAYFHGNL